MDQSLLDYSDAPNKGFIPIGGRMMVEYSIDAARETGMIDRVALVSNPQWVPDNVKNKVDFVVSGGDSVPSSLRNGVEALSPEPDRVLVLPCDMPMLNVQTVTDFLEKSLDPPVDITYAYLSRKNSEAEYPAVKHTYVKMSEGEFCGTGLFLMKPSIVDSCERLFRKLTENRKNPIGLASLLGIRIIVKFLFKTLTIKETESRILSIMGCSGRGIETQYAQAGFNVDAPGELNIARELLG